MINVAENKKVKVLRGEEKYVKGVYRQVGVLYGVNVRELVYSYRKTYTSVLRGEMIGYAI